MTRETQEFFERVEQIYTPLCYQMNGGSKTTHRLAIEAIGKNAVEFCKMIITQFHRCNGYRFSDYNREAKGWLNPERVCSTIADRRNDLAIKYATKAYDAGVKCANFEEIAFDRINTPRKEVLEEVVRLCITDMHKSLQSNLVVACVDYLIYKGLLEADFNKAI